MSNKYTRLAPSSGLNDLPMVSIPFEQLDQLAGTAQQEKNTFDRVNAMKFNSLERDKGLASKVNEYQANIGSQLTDVAHTKSVSEYRSALWDATKNLVNLRQPGGAVYALEERFKQDASVRKQMYDKYKKDASSINYEYALSQYDPGDINFNIDRGTFNSISAPNVQNYLDIRKELEDTAKAMVPEGEEYSYIKDGYVWTKSGKRYKVNEAMQSFLRDETVQNQLNIEAWHKTQGLTPDVQNMLISKASDAAKKKFNELESTQSRLYALNYDGSHKSIVELQTFLKEQGLYKGAIDGDYGPLTNRAFEQMDRILIEAMGGMKTTFSPSDVPGIVKEALEESYSAYLGALRPNSISHKIKSADWKARLASKSATVKHLMESLIVREDSDLIPGYLAASSVDFDEKRKEAVSARKEMEVGIAKSMDKLKSAGVIASDVDIPMMKHMYSKLDQLTSEGVLSDDEIVDEMALLFGYTTPEAKRVVSALKYDDNGIKQSLIEHQRLNNTLDAIEGTEQEHTEQYVEKNGDEYLREVYDRMSRGEGARQESPLWFLQRPKQMSVDMSQFDSYEDFQRKFISGDDLNADARQFLEPFRTEFKGIVKEDVLQNQSDYKSTINYGINSGNSPILEDLEGLFVDMETRGFFDQTGDVELYPSEYTVDGNTVKNLSKEKPTVNISSIGGETALVFSRKTDDGKVARKTVRLPDGIQQNYLGEELMKMAATAVNHDRPQDLLTLLPMIYNENPLQQYAYTNINPSREQRVTIKLNEESPFIAVPSQIIKSYGDIKAVAVRSPYTGDIKYYHGIYDSSTGELEVLPDLSGNVGEHSDARTAVMNVMARKFVKEKSNFIAEQEFKNDKVVLPTDTRADLIMSLIK